MESLEEIKARAESALPGAQIEIIPNPSPAKQASPSGLRVCQCRALRALGATDAPVLDCAGGRRENNRGRIGFT